MPIEGSDSANKLPAEYTKESSCSAKHTFFSFSGYYQCPSMLFWSQNSFVMLWVQLAMSPHLPRGGARSVQRALRNASLRPGRAEGLKNLADSVVNFLRFSKLVRLATARILCIETKGVRE